MQSWIWVIIKTGNGKSSIVPWLQPFGIHWEIAHCHTTKCWGNRSWQEQASSAMITQSHYSDLRQDIFKSETKIRLQFGFQFHLNLLNFVTSKICMVTCIPKIFCLLSAQAKGSIEAYPVDFNQISIVYPNRYCFSLCSCSAPLSNYAGYLHLWYIYENYWKCIIYAIQYLSLLFDWLKPEDAHVSYLMVHSDSIEGNNAKRFWEEAEFFLYHRLVNAKVSLRALFP